VFGRPGRESLAVPVTRPEQLTRGKQDRLPRLRGGGEAEQRFIAALREPVYGRVLPVAEAAWEVTDSRDFGEPDRLAAAGGANDRETLVTQGVDHFLQSRHADGRRLPSAPETCVLSRRDGRPRGLFIVSRPVCRPGLGWVVAQHFSSSVSATQPRAALTWQQGPSYLAAQAQGPDLLLCCHRGKNGCEIRRGRGVSRRDQGTTITGQWACRASHPGTEPAT
jgi:hypothetical protein